MRVGLALMLATGGSRHWYDARVALHYSDGGVLTARCGVGEIGLSGREHWEGLKRLQL